jgi:hypothetical protein
MPRRKQQEGGKRRFRIDVLLPSEQKVAVMHILLILVQREFDLRLALPNIRATFGGSGEGDVERLILLLQSELSGAGVLQRDQPAISKTSRSLDESPKPQEFPDAGLSEDKQSEPGGARASKAKETLGDICRQHLPYVLVPPAGILLWLIFRFLGL